MYKMQTQNPMLNCHLCNICNICIVCNSYRGMHDCLVPVTPWLANIFESLRTTKKIPCKVRAMDMRHILLLLLFLLPNLLKEEVEEYNHLNPFAPISDPSDETSSGTYKHSYFTT